jgi:thioredoxin-like negative regulator of GroEL
MTGIVELTDSNFEELVYGAPHFLVYAYATWSYPCLKVTPEVLEHYASVLPIQIGKLNIDHEWAIASEKTFISIPTFRLYKGKHILDEIVGESSLLQLRDILIEAVWGDPLIDYQTLAAIHRVDEEISKDH